MKEAFPDSCDWRGFAARTHYAPAAARSTITGKGTQLEMARPIYNLEAWALATRNPGTQAF